MESCRPTCRLGDQPCEGGENLWGSAASRGVCSLWRGSALWGIWPGITLSRDGITWSRDERQGVLGLLADEAYLFFMYHLLQMAVIQRHFSFKIENPELTNHKVENNVHFQLTRLKPAVMRGKMEGSSLSELLQKQHVNQEVSNAEKFYRMILERKKGKKNIPGVERHILCLFLSNEFWIWSVRSFHPRGATGLGCLVETPRRFYPSFLLDYFPPTGSANGVG